MSLLERCISKKIEVAEATKSLPPGSGAMSDEQVLREIREANLSYLLLAQTLLRRDRCEALYRLGLSDAAADILADLTLAQCLRIASQNVLICRFRFTDDQVWNLLTQHGQENSAKKLHSSILLASQSLETIA
jgi:flagellar transcriptional activator FlhD